MAAEMDRALANIPAGTLTRLGTKRLPFWCAYLSGANAWIEYANAEAVRATLKSRRVCEVEWVRWEEFGLASATADYWGSQVSAATSRVADQILTKRTRDGGAG